jgi:hypothetical protein
MTRLAVTPPEMDSLPFYNPRSNQLLQHFTLTPGHFVRVFVRLCDRLHKFTSACLCCNLSFDLLLRVEQIRVPLKLAVSSVSADFHRNRTRNARQFHFVASRSAKIVRSLANEFRVVVARVYPPVCLSFAIQADALAVKVTPHFGQRT